VLLQEYPSWSLTSVLGLAGMAQAEERACRCTDSEVDGCGFVARGCGDRGAVGEVVVVPFVCGCGQCTWCVSGNAQVCPDQWQPGFHGPGSYAEFAAIPRADFNVVTLPDGLPFDVAASLGCRFATAYRGIIDVAGVGSGDTVAIFGCGGVGLAAVMIARSRGARVIGVDVPSTAATCRSACCHRTGSVITPPCPCTPSSAANSASTAATAWQPPTTRACSRISRPGCSIPRSSSRARSPSATHPRR
jgi:Alcohol dehydrogenase GroES-like domain